MLLACRSITHLIDILPAACASVVHNQAVPALCAKLLNIEYIDLAEQAMSALEKLSVEHGVVCMLLLFSRQSDHLGLLFLSSILILDV